MSARRSLWALVAAVCVAAAAGAVRAESPEEEQVRVRERLEAEREALSALKAQKTDVLTLLDAFERLSRESRALFQRLEGQHRALEASLTLAKRLDDLAQRAHQRELERLAPRLRAMYRAQKQDRLSALAGADDFAQMVKRTQALELLVEQDAAALARVRGLARASERSAAELGRLDAFAQARLAMLREEGALAKLRQAAFVDLLHVVQAEASQSERLIKELERADRQLQALVADLHSAIPHSGFRAKRGRLVYPTRGMLEVRFGKVVNPKFNTVTVQKGIDLRAPAGTPVVSVAPGTVAYAGWLKGYGNLVIVDHGGGYHSLMAHLSEVQVEPGNEVEEEEVIGAVGDTGSLKGAYLYFEIRHKGEAIDPLPWLDPSAAP